MKRTVCAMIVAAVLTTQADVLVGNLENGTKRNQLGCDWYYFSDVNDSGSSLIYGVALKPDGSYEDLKGSSPGHASNMCARMDFKLDKDMVPYRPAFVGLGTDLAPPGKKVDISYAKAISFWARGADSLWFFIEIVTEDIKDFGYYRSGGSQISGKDWVKYTIPLNNAIGGIFIPSWATIPKEPMSYSLAQAQKINWQITNYNAITGKTKFLEIDDVVIEGIDTIIQFGTTSARNTRPRPCEPRPARELPRTSCDALGRLLSCGFHASGAMVKYGQAQLNVKANKW